MAMVIQRAVRSVLAVAVGAFAASASGLSLIIDDPVEPNNGYTVTGFAGFDSGGFGAFIGADRLEGANTAWYNQDAAFAKTFAGQAVSPGTYTVQFGLGNYNNAGWPGVADVRLSGIGLSDTIALSNPAPTSGNWSLWSATWAIPTDHPAVGSPLSFNLDIGSAAGNGTFDGVGGFNPDGDGLLIYYGSDIPAALPKLSIVGGPRSDDPTTQVFNYSNLRVNNTGTAVTRVSVVVDGSLAGFPSYRWDTTGASTQLKDINGQTGIDVRTFAFDLNDAGTVVGLGENDRGGTWDASGEFTLLAGPNGEFARSAVAINDAGQVAGTYNQSSGGFAARWDAAGVATELDPIDVGESPTFPAPPGSTAHSINDAGTVVGSGVTYSLRNDRDNNTGNRPVRWDAGGDAAEQLQIGGNNLFRDSDGHNSGFAEAVAVNNHGDAAGYANTYNTTTGAPTGQQAMFWPDDPSATIFSPLSPSFGSFGIQYSEAIDLNDDLIVIGRGDFFSGSSRRGRRALVWDLKTSGIPIELPNLGTFTNGATSSSANAVNSAGLVAGSTSRYEGGVFQGGVAVFWMPGSYELLDLNTLGLEDANDPGTWNLTNVNDLSEDGWIAGVGEYDPDGNGPMEAFIRPYLTQVGLGGSWTGDSGTWGRGPNWSTGTPALGVGDALFDRDAAYSVTLDEDTTTRSVTLTDGTVTLNTVGHTLTALANFTIEEGATLAGNASIEGSVINRGTITPGNSPGLLSVNGSLNSTGIIELEVGGVNAGSDYDQLAVTGELTLGGTLRLILVNGYEPGDDSTFDLFVADSIVGRFEAIELPDLSNLDLSWDTAALAIGQLSVQALDGLLGDYDGSGTVEQGDLNLVLTNWGQNAPFDSNGVPFATATVDQEELNRVLTNWGNTAPPSFAGFTVPEPAAGLGLGLGLGLTVRRSRSVGFASDS